MTAGFPAMLRRVCAQPPAGLATEDLAGFLARQGGALWASWLRATAPEGADWWREAAVLDTPAEHRPDTTTLLPLADYDAIIVAFSGGKDSIAATLFLLALMDAQGVPRERLELWHHHVDGAPGSGSFMDWPVTESYVSAFGAAFGLVVRFQWKEGGFLREMLREDAPTAPTSYETAEGVLSSGGTSSNRSTRRMFPQLSGSMSTRWCSAYLKIDVGRAAINGDPRFQEDARVLLVTGERREESPGRARYAALERHRSSSQRRRVDQWRAILGWNEALVWAVLHASGVRPHPVYEIGYGRASCAACIFGGPLEWASFRSLAPERFREIAHYERSFGKTIHRERTVTEQADQAAGEALFPADQLAWAKQQVMTTTFSGPVLVSPDQWTLPAGAFRAAHGPT